jgi:hypothetical protein
VQKEKEDIVRFGRIPVAYEEMTISSFLLFHK